MDIMNLFERKFRKLFKESDSGLEEALTSTMDDDTVEGDNADLQQEMNDSIESSKEHENEVKEADKLLKGKIEKRIKEGNDKIAEWAAAIEEFATFINDASNEQSIRHIVDNAGNGSALASVKQSANKQMTKVATDCVVLAQTLKSLVGSVSVNDILSK